MWTSACPQVHSDTLWTQNTELHCAGCRATHETFGWILVTGGRNWRNDTVEFFFSFFTTVPSGVGSVVSRAICPAARPLCMLVSVPVYVFTGIIQQQIVYLLRVLRVIFCSILKPDRNTHIPSTLISHFNRTLILTK